MERIFQPGGLHNEGIAVPCAVTFLDCDAPIYPLTGRASLQVALKVSPQSALKTQK